jgi:hypothetical protein
MNTYELTLLKFCKKRNKTQEESVIFFLQSGVSSQRAEQLLLENK